MENENPEFKHIVRIANTDLPGKQAVCYAMTKIKGVGFRLAAHIVKSADVSMTKKIGDLSDEEVATLAESLEASEDITPPWMLNRQKDYDSGEDRHIYSTELTMTRTENLNRLKKIRSYRGQRHEGGHRVRGQRSRSNGRSGLTMGVKKKRN